MFFLMYGLGGVLAVIGVVILLLAILYVLGVTGILANFFSSIANAIASFFMGLLISAAKGLLELLKLLALPSLIIGGIVLLVWLIRRTYFSKDR